MQTHSHEPLAYLITFPTYGTWLHGDDRGSVDRRHNVPGTVRLAADPARRETCAARMIEPPLQLEAAQRQTVLSAILEVCRHRHWRAYAVHVRQTHVHAVVRGNAKPEKIMNDFKAYASRTLSRTASVSERPSSPTETRTKYWARHGSTRYLWTEEEVAEKIRYVRDEQGPLMAYGEWLPAETDLPNR